MNNLPLVSIIIPIYNSGTHIIDTLESVINQTYSNIEIIVVDDGSTDNSYEIAKKYESEKIKVYSKINEGASEARNYGFRKSKGEYIQYLDADDIISASKIQNQINLFFKYGNNIIVSGQWDRFYKNHLIETTFPKRFLDRNWDAPIEWLLNVWQGKGMAQPAVWLVHRSIIQITGEWNRTMIANDDGEFFCRVLLIVDKIYFCKEAYVYYRSGIEYSLSNRKDHENVISILNSFKLYKKHILKVEDSKRVRLALKFNFINFIYINYDKYPNLIPLAKKEIIDLGFEVDGNVGGRKFKTLKCIFGFERTLKIRKYFHMLRK